MTDTQGKRWMKQGNATAEFARELRYSGDIYREGRAARLALRRGRWSKHAPRLAPALPMPNIASRHFYRRRYDIAAVGTLFRP